MIDFLLTLKDTIQDYFRGNLLGGRRSSQWRRVRNAYLKENPICAVCGGTEKCQVHHIQMFNDRPDLELDPENLITLCNKRWRRCHFIWGHKYNYRKINPDIVEDARKWRDKL